jgi:hypothetical protein
MPKDASQSRFRFLIVVAVGLTCTAALAIALTIWWLRADAIADASQDTGNLATVLAHQINNSMQSIDLVLTEIRDQEEIRGANAPSNLIIFFATRAQINFCWNVFRVFGRLNLLRWWTSMEAL